MLVRKNIVLGVFIVFERAGAMLAAVFPRPVGA
jgi:hypothetical protein